MFDLYFLDFGFWFFLGFGLVFVCHHRFLKHRLGSGFGFGFHKDKYLKANYFNLKKKLTDIGFGFFKLDIEKNLVFVWILDSD